MADTFNSGDVVVLASGGPKMTYIRMVEGTTADEKLAHCMWFNDKNQKFEDDFPFSSLVKPMTAEEQLKLFARLNR